MEVVGSSLNKIGRFIANPIIRHIVGDSGIVTTIELDSDLAEQALRLIQEEHPDVVLLDIELPDIKGYEVARRITDKGLAVNILAKGFDIP